MDALYINALGRLILAEFKLWRNPQARREVIGQILDYTKELASWTYEDLQREVSRALRRKGNVPYELVRAHAPDVDEAQFVDNVSRHLRRGEYLLLIIGDGIREGVESIVNFVQNHSGLHFNLALVEAALYRDTVDRIIVQPRVLTRTEVVRRIVVEGGQMEDLAAEEGDGVPAPSESQRENVRFWTAVGSRSWRNPIGFPTSIDGKPSAGGLRMLPQTVRVFRTGFSRSEREFEEILTPCRETSVFR